MPPITIATQALVLLVLGQTGAPATTPPQARTGGLLKAPLTREQLQEVGRLSAETLAKEAKGDFNGARAATKKILALDPNNEIHMNRMAGLSGQMQLFDDELVWAEKAITVNPKYADAHLNKGAALASLGKADEARSSFEQAATLDAKNAMAPYSLGVLAEQKGDFEEALALYDKAVALDDRCEPCHFNAAAMNGNLGRFPQAKAELRKVLALKPGDPDAQKMLEQLDARMATAKTMKTEVAGILATRICGDDLTCCLSRAESAGQDRAGRSMTVLNLDQACQLVGRAKRRGSGDETTCHPYANWLVVHKGKKLVSRQLLTSECNDGYGAANLGEDQVETKNNIFTHDRSGGSNWRWSRGVSMVLDPLHVAGESWSGEFVINLDQSGSEAWNLDEFTGSGTRGLPLCSANAAGEESSEADVESAGGINASYLLIPSISLPAAYVNGGWKTTALAGCSILVDGEKHGFTVHGSQAATADESFRVVASRVGDDVFLFVEIKDDHWVGPGQPIHGKSWLYDDHLELWASDTVAWDGDCTNKQHGLPEQWGIRITDGKVFPAMGKPTAKVAVERVFAADASNVARLKIKVPPNGGNVTLVYSASDEGNEQKRLIATSTVRLGWAATLGVFHEVKPTEATCVVRDKRLETKLAPPPKKRDPEAAMYEF